MRSVVDCFGFSISKERPNGENQDFFEVRPALGLPPLRWADFAAVATDGVGSSSSPRSAAIAAAKSWMLHAEAKFIENAEKCAYFDDVHFDEITIHAFSQAHEAVGKETVGSACAASVCLQGSRLLVGNVGDCRVYRITGPRIEQISNDQVDEQGDPTDVIGGKRAPRPYTLSSTRVRAGDIVLLCTDGVWRLISPEEIRQSTAKGNAREIASRLQELLTARRKPSSDDATAVVCVIRSVGRPFWENNTLSEPGEDRLNDDSIDKKLNEVLAELLNRLRAPLEKQNARAEQTLSQLSASVEDLRGEIESLRAETGHVGTRGKTQVGDWRSTFATVALCALLLVGGIFLGMDVNNRDAKPRLITPQLPTNAKVVSREYVDGNLLVYFNGQNDTRKLAIYRLEDGGRPFAIIDLPKEKPTGVPVP